jgi:hypothetical protein
MHYTIYNILYIVYNILDIVYWIQIQCITLYSNTTPMLLFKYNE